MSRNRHHKRAKNFINFNTTSMGVQQNLGADRQNFAKDLRNYISPVQLTRLKQDVASWRQAIAEAERAYYPFRVKMQRMFIDTILNGHVFSLMERRKDLTTLRNYKICDKNGVQSDDLTQMMQSQMWFEDFIEYALDAKFFGYSLISLGDVLNDEIQECSLIPRWFVSPDRHDVGTYIYATSGKDFRESPQSDWHVYVKTKSDNGASPCGYGLFYNLALYEIVLRNTLGFNADFVELYAMPYRLGKTTKTNETERAELEAAVRDMGSAGYAIIDPQDDISFLESKMAGTGYQSYESLLNYCQKIASKIVLGHADAVDSTPGKLGSGQGGKDGANMDGSPVSQALADKQAKDAKFIEPVVNRQLFPKLAKILPKIAIPEGYHFEYVNDGEDMQARKEEDESNLQTATVAQTMKSAGLQMDAKYFEKRTGITTSEAPPPPAPGFAGKGPQDTKIKNKLKELYK
jgi:phage gp29-like protein